MSLLNKSQLAMVDALVVCAATACTRAPPTHHSNSGFGAPANRSHVQIDPLAMDDGLGDDDGTNMWHQQAEATGPQGAQMGSEPSKGAAAGPPGSSVGGGDVQVSCGKRAAAASACTLHCNSRQPCQAAARSHGQHLRGCSSWPCTVPLPMLSLLHDCCLG